MSCQKVEEEHPRNSKAKCLFTCWECIEKKVDIKCSKCQKIDPEARFESTEHKGLYQAGYINYVCSECDVERKNVK